ncbi:hypothetical protein SO802_032533 [Lithocarpus litseifolius]|uniref:PGG domain-containing protein n=1 Tax=Lithocarpus litseifolius TaxID=425828 RepID=A0AAW2BBZ3_9ROSI
MDDKGWRHKMRKPIFLKRQDRLPLMTMRHSPLKRYLIDLDIVQPPDQMGWAMHILGVLSRNRRTKLKKYHVKVGVTKEQLLADTPPGVMEDQWREMVNYWFLEETVRVSDKNKDSRGKQKEIARSGAQSFAQICDDINRIEELLSQPDMRLQGEPGSGVLWSKDDVYARVLGPERPGRVHGVGLGITPSGRSATNASQFTSTPLLPSRTTQRISELENHSSRVTEQLGQVQEQLAQTEARHQEQLSSIEARHQEQLSSIEARHQQQMAELMARMNSIFDQIGQGFPSLHGSQGSTKICVFHLVYGRLPAGNIVFYGSVSALLSFGLGYHEEGATTPLSTVHYYYIMCNILSTAHDLNPTISIASMFSRVLSPSTALENLEEITDNFEETINFEKKIYKKVRSRQWADVVIIYRDHFDQAHKVMAMLRETVLHLAIAHGSEDVVEDLVKIIDDNKDRFKNVLQYKNDQGNTPLHVAASTGSLRTCVCIAKADPSMGNERNKEDLAYRILLLHGELATCVDKNGILPIHLLAEKPSAFRSGCHLGWWSMIIYHWTPVDVPKKINKSLTRPLNKRREHKFPENYQTCVSFIQLLRRWTIQVVAIIGKVCDKVKNADEENPERSNVTTKSRHEGSQSEDHKHYSIWKYCCAPYMIIMFACRGIKRILGFGEIKKIKETHRLSVKIMKLCIKPISVEHYFDGGTNPWLTRYEDEDFSFINAFRDIVSAYSIQPPEEKETPILSAAKNGIKEMVMGILHKFPMAIHDENTDGKNIVLLAAEYRRTQVYELFRKSHLRIESMFHKLDKNGNSALHLAAEQPELREQKSGLIPGAALQMQWEIKWYEHIMNSVPRGFVHLSNNEGKTPGEIFMEKHKDLVEEGGKWLRDTSNACSIVAGLFVTVAFNMSTTVPGDVDDKGNPHFERQLAFNFFAISSYVSFYSSLLSVIMFLAILTSGHKESSFRSTLPIKLLLALTAFYLSIASTAICFSAAHFFILREKLKSAAFPSYSWAVLLLIFFAIAGFPLYFHLTWAIFKKVPRHHHLITPAGFHIKH